MRCLDPTLVPNTLKRGIASKSTLFIYTMTISIFVCVFLRHLLAQILHWTIHPPVCWPYNMLLPMTSTPSIHPLGVKLKKSQPEFMLCKESHWSGAMPKYQGALVFWHTRATQHPPAHHHPLESLLWLKIWMNLNRVDVEFQLINLYYKK